MGQNAGFFRSIVRRIFLGARTSSKDEKHHESNLVWGPLGIGSSIVLTVIAAMKHDLRFLFFAAWPCFVFGLWRLCRYIPYKRLAGWIVLICGVVLAIGLWFLSAWLRPETTAGVTHTETKDSNANANSSADKSPKVDHIPQRPQSQPPSKRKLHLVFSESPVWTDAAKDHLQRHLDRFYEYLVTVGFSPPLDVPPIDVFPGRRGLGRMANTPGTIYDMRFSIGELSLAEPINILRLYGPYAFEVLLSGYQSLDSLDDHDALRTSLAEVFGTYYACSYVGICTYQASDDSWRTILLEIRQRCGAAYMDRVMFYAFKRIEPLYEHKGVTFDEFFARRLWLGQAVIANMHEVRPEVQEILKEHHKKAD